MAEPTPTELNDFLGAKPVPRWRQRLKWVVVAVVLLLLIFALSRCFRGPEGVSYSTEPVERGALTVTVSATGKLAPTNQIEVGSELSGLITKVVVDVNDRVTAGQALALIDPQRLDDAIKQSQAAVNARLADVATAKATQQEARAQLARLEEVSRLSGGRVPAKTELETARAAAARATASVRAAEANVNSARAQLSSDQTQRARAIIRSPVDGVVLARQIEPGQTVASSFNTPTLFVIAQDLSSMQLEVAIDEADVGQVKEGQRADFTVDAFPGATFPARIIRVDLGSNLTTSSTSSTTTTSTTGQVVSYAAILSVENPELRLRPGMTATAEIVTVERPQVLLVPNAALRFTPSDDTAGASSGGRSGIAGALLPGPRRGRGGAKKSATQARGGQQTVYILGEDGKPQPVQITTGDTNGQVTEVVGGALKPGMKVITGQLAAGEKAIAGGPRGGGGGARGK
ncbi:efflux RND transporter periplasmic adaptor subunit [Sphingomonas sp. 3-13AW]|uniref:efflux RND transporter periplasmic adaptor subunit n=1 Tax=Sphingomonas sp. 3-13AW TaxID=3050450 RepID=UPI003BB6C5BD